jgi:hypothetical protein
MSSAPAAAMSIAATVVAGTSTTCTTSDPIALNQTAEPSPATAPAATQSFRGHAMTLRPEQTGPLIEPVACPQSNTNFMIERWQLTEW